MKTRYLFIIIFLSFTGGLEILGQTPFIKNISLFRGKEDYNVNTIYQDPNGWIWMGTDRGLFRYDGISSVLFTMEDSLAGDNVTAITCDSSGTLWIGHHNGKISLLENERIRQFRPESGLGNLPVTDITTDIHGNIWFSTLGEGISKFNGRHLSNVDRTDGISDNYVYDIEFDSKGNMWLATDYGITFVGENSTRIISMKDGIPDNIVRVIQLEEERYLWLGMDEGGIARLDLEDLSIIAFPGWEFGSINGLVIDTDKDLWVSTRSQGVIRVKFNDDFSDASYSQMNTSDGLHSNRLSALMQDFEKNIWIAGRQGVSQVLPPVFEFLNQASGTPFEKVYSFTTDREGNYWVCSDQALFKGLRSENGKLQWLTVYSSQENRNINFISVHLDSRGDIWAGTYGSGVFRFHPDGRLKNYYTTSDGLRDENVIYISGEDSIVWLSTLGGGVSAFDLSSNRMLENITDDELNHSYIYAVKEGAEGRTWLAGTLKAPAYIKDHKLYYIPVSDEKFPQLYGIAIDSLGNAWYNTNDNGILHIKDDSIYGIGPAQGITFSEIQAIEFDKRGILMIISNQGISFYKPGYGVIRQFGENSGLAYLYPSLNAVFEDGEGKIWIGTKSGLIKYNPDYLEQGSQQPSIFLSSIRLFNKAIDRSSRSYKYNQNNFTFEFTGIWFTNPDALSYRYMLEGYDLDWIYSIRNQATPYSRLPPGKYNYRVNVSIDGKNWFDSGKGTFGFEIRPPFWQRIWFIALMIFISIIGILSYVRQRLKNLERAKNRLEMEVQKRTEEIRNQNEELEAQKEEIATQRDMAESQRDQIEFQNNEIQASIRYACNIQTAVLPPKVTIDTILSDYFILNMPRDIVSGDFYWVSEKNSQIFFAAADCTGHGVPGAFMSMLGLTALNDIVKSLEICNPAFVLKVLNQRIMESLHNNSEDQRLSKDGLDISLCIYESESRILQFAGAHNDLYIIRGGELIIVKADNMGIGADQSADYEFRNHELQLEEGDILYLFSDGFPDQFGGPEHKKYKYQPFREFLLRIHRESMQQQRNLLNEEISGWIGESPQIDDILVMGVRL
jgi:ligand-binding sensor domain-containing protein/serine phosphatase RsbU (regulator of sigma subunit)